MNVLIVAQYSPELTDLLDEVGEVVSMLGATLIQGEVTEQALIARTRGKQFDLAIFTGHGTEQGYLLSNGYILKPETMGVYLKRWGATSAIINTCYSWRWVAGIQRNQPVEVVTAILDQLDDRDAWRCVVLMVERLQAGENLQIAASESGSLSHIYWPAPLVISRKAGEGVDNGNYQYLRVLENSLNELKLQVVKDAALMAGRLALVEDELNRLRTQSQSNGQEIRVLGDKVDATNEKIDATIEQAHLDHAPAWKINVILVAVLVMGVLLTYGLYYAGNVR